MFKSKESVEFKNMAEYFKIGWLSETFQKDKALYQAFVKHIISLKKLGIEFTQISKIILLGQIEEDTFKMVSIKEELMHNHFNGNFNSEVFDPTKNYINLEQLSLRNGDVFVIAEYSPSDYFNSIKPGFLWKIKLSKELKLHPDNKTELIFEAKQSVHKTRFT